MESFHALTRETWDLNIKLSLVGAYVQFAMKGCIHYNDVIMSAMASQITGISTVCSTVGLFTAHRKHQSSALLAFVRGIHRWPVNFPHKRPVTRKIFPFDDVIMIILIVARYKDLMNNDKGTIVTHRRVSLNPLTFSWWRHNPLQMHYVIRQLWCGHVKSEI